MPSKSSPIFATRAERAAAIAKHGKPATRAERAAAIAAAQAHRKS